MPTLNWTNKKAFEPNPSALATDSLVYPQGAGYPHAAAQSHLIHGDNLGVMAALLPEYEGKIDLIYTDPPFFTNRSFPARIGRGEDSRRPQNWLLADGYPDAWPDLDAYLDMLYPRLQLMHRLLAPTGTLYLHLDWHASAYARLLLDEIFGADRLLNEIAWVYHGPSPIRSAFNRKHDTILVYTKGKEYTFNADAVRQPYDPNTVKTFASSAKAGFGKVPNLARGKVPEDWWYFPVVARLHNERTGYPTQKPEALLERVILASSNPGDLVADFFCGSGTAPVAAARLGRRFLASDITWRAIHTTRSRLVREKSVSAFQIQRASGSTTPESRLENCKPVHLDPTGRNLILEPESLPELEYWEVDPDWDGRLFRSAAQAVRAHRAKGIPVELKLPGQTFGEAVFVRLLTTEGEMIPIEL